MNIKFLSLNLFEGGLLFDNIKTFLRAEQPNIIAFQEVNGGEDPNLPAHSRSMEILTQELPDFHSFFAPEMLMRYPEGEIDLGNALFSRFPISNQKTIFFTAPYGTYDPVPIGGDFSHHPKNMQVCDVTVGNQTLTVGNLHGIWGLDGGDNPERLKMSQMIIDAVKDKANVILAGDFNLKPDTQTIRNIEQHLHNVFKDELATSFNLQRKDTKRFPGYASAVVDMIFTSSDVKITQHFSPEVDVSDHLPLMVEVEV